MRFVEINVFIPLMWNEDLKINEAGSPKEGLQ